MNKRPPEFNPDYPGMIVKRAYLKSQKEIIEMVEKGLFEGSKKFNQDRAG